MSHPHSAVGKRVDPAAVGQVAGEASQSKEKAVGPTPLIDVLISGIKVKAVYDTGSQVSIVSEKLYREKFRGVELKTGTWYRLTAADGLDIPLLGYLVTEVVVGGDEPVQNVVVMVARSSSGNPPDCILGTNVIQFLQQPPPLEQLKSQQKTTSCQVRTADKTSIPPHTVLRVEMTGGHTSMSGNVLFEPSPCPPMNGIHVLAAYTYLQDGRLSVPVANLTDETLILPSRASVGTLTTDASIPHQRVNLIVNQAASRDSTCQARDDMSGTHNVDHSGGDKDCPVPDLTQLQIGQGLSKSERRQVDSLVREYTDIFAWDDMDVGYTEVVRHKIVLTDPTPCAQPYRRIPQSVLGEVKEHLEDLLQRGVIQPSSSSYAAPIVLVRKKSGELRMCVDYRRLNSITRRDMFPLPRIDECLDAIGGASLFSTLDLASGYHQVAMAEEDMQKTAFTCPYGLYEFRRMPFGLCNAPATFQRLMQTSMHDFIFKILLCYLDDLLVFASSFDKHIENLELVFKRLKTIGVKLNPSKCKLLHNSVGFLGHVISEEGISTNPDTIRAVQDFETPKTLKQVRSFLGLASYYRRFVEGFSKIALPLHSLCTEVHKKHEKDRHKGEKCNLGELWTPECQQAFDLLKHKLTTAPVLKYADYSRDFIVEVDASFQGLGAVLSQKDDDGKVHPIAYASRTLRPNEKNMSNYSSLKLELLGLKWAVSEKFRGYLLGHHFVVFTDNNPLSHMDKARFGATEQRWISELQVFNFETKYKPGRTNTNADALSRNPVEIPGPDREQFVTVALVSGQLVPPGAIQDDLLYRPVELPWDPQLEDVANNSTIQQSTQVCAITVQQLAAAKGLSPAPAVDAAKLAELQATDPDIGPI